MRSRKARLDAADVRRRARARSRPRGRSSPVGADLDAADPDGATALVLAIINGHYDVAAALLEKGAKPNPPDGVGMTALYAAIDMHTLPWHQGRPEPNPSGALRPLDVSSSCSRRAPIQTPR